MKFKWIITDEDIKLLTGFVNIHKENNFVKIRIKRNLLDNPPLFSKEEFWKQIISCLLTTRQRSGPNSKIFKFLTFNPFPLNYDFCKKSENLQKDAFKILTKFGGIRRTNRISEEIKYNFSLLENGFWKNVNEIYDELVEARKNPNLEKIKIERKACLLVQRLKGIGPKQSRNLWQDLGLTRYEIPIDSRIIKWLNKNGFPFRLSASGLSDENYYELIMDGIQKWCSESDIFPCVLDAVIFSSYDK